MNLKRILEKIALQNGVSVAQVRCEIQKVLDEGWNSEGETIQSNWRKIPTKHKKPTMEEVIAYIINSIE